MNRQIKLYLVLLSCLVVFICALFDIERSSIILQGLSGVFIALFTYFLMKNADEQRDLMREQLGAAQTAAKAASDAVAESRRQSKQTSQFIVNEQRPWLGINEIIPSKFIFSSDQRPPYIHVEFDFWLENFGTSPAVKCWLGVIPNDATNTSSAEALEKLISSSHVADPLRLSATVFPKHKIAEVAYAKFELPAAYLTGTVVTPQFFGAVFYEFETGKTRHYTSFTFSLFAKDRGGPNGIGLVPDGSDQASFLTVVAHGGLSRTCT